MGKALAERYPAAARVFAEVDDALGQPLSRLMFDGPESRADAHRQRPAGADGGEPRGAARARGRGRPRSARDAAFVAGHSLGEYSALAAAGTFSIAEAARLLRLRGDAMQEAVPVGQGAMAALLGVEPERPPRSRPRPPRARSATSPTTTAAARSWCRAPRPRSSARSRSPRRGASSAPCCSPVSAPFHCALMRPAADAMAEALARPRSPTRSCRSWPTSWRARSTRPARSAALVGQVCGTVRWRESVAWMAEAGVDALRRDRGRQGAGRARQAHRARRPRPRTIGTPDDVAGFIAAVSA